MCCAGEGGGPRAVPNTHLDRIPNFAEEVLLKGSNGDIQDAVLLPGLVGRDALRLGQLPADGVVVHGEDGLSCTAFTGEPGSSVQRPAQSHHPVPPLILPATCARSVLL